MYVCMNIHICVYIYIHIYTYINDNNNNNDDHNHNHDTNFIIGLDLLHRALLLRRLQPADGHVCGQGLYIYIYIT